MNRHALVIQLDGAMPNLALMRLASHLRREGVRVEYRRAQTATAVRRGLYDAPWEAVYASLIFERTAPVARALLESYPQAIIGGTGWDVATTLEDRCGVSAGATPDYGDQPNYPHSIGFTQRGCRLNCPFCVVPRKEGKVTAAATVSEIWRGDPHPRNVVLLDNDFFGQPRWQDRIDEIKAGGFKVSFTQGFNVRLIGDQEAAAIASVPYYDATFTTRRLYTAWDSRKDEGRLFRNLESLTRHGVRPDDIMVYILVAYWDGPRITADDHYRRERLREFGCRPYPMPYVRNRETVGFQRWVVGAYDKRISWDRWVAAGYQPRRLGSNEVQGLFA